jgi:ligand-binding SRPBCC domain-containing protein
MALTVERLPGDQIIDACEIDYTIRWLRVPIRWTTVISDIDRPRRFVDQQKRGPYKRWWHEHRFEQLTDEITLMTDRIEYDLPFGILGGVAHGVAVRRQLLDILEYRAGVISRLFPRPSIRAVDAQLTTA